MSVIKLTNLFKGSQVCLRLVDTVTNELPNGLEVNQLLTHRGLAEQCARQDLNVEEEVEADIGIMRCPLSETRNLRLPSCSSIIQEILQRPTSLQSYGK